MKAEIKEQAAAVLAGFDPEAPGVTADRLRELWLQAEPKSIAGIKAEQRALQETAGTPIPVLRAIGQAVARAARKRECAYLSLARLLWDAYGREGRVVAAMILGVIELVDPETVVPLLQTLCCTCYTWEDADRLAMDALEPIVRKRPEEWLPRLATWLEDDNKWVRRAGITVVGRLPMKQAAYTDHCVGLAERLLLDEEVDVKRAVSFAFRVAARGEVGPVRDALARHVPPEDSAATWVLCDAIRSMATKLLPEFVSLLPLYERWAADPALSARDRRSVESAVKKLRRVRARLGPS
jgi:3-methyladenine DNA glycosylase AlkD